MTYGKRGIVPHSQKARKYTTLRVPVSYYHELSYDKNILFKHLFVIRGSINNIRALVEGNNVTLDCIVSITKESGIHNTYPVSISSGWNKIPLAFMVDALDRVTVSVVGGNKEGETYSIWIGFSFNMKILKS